jgi:epoxyqueuosine reductase
LEPDTLEPDDNNCADCRKCITACPTGALYAPYKVNPSRCINPLTRKEENIPLELRGKMSNWICGCDICQEVCPVNRKLKPRKPDPRAGFDPGTHSSHRTRVGLNRCPELKSILENDHLPELKRNAINALANIRTKEAIDILERHKDVFNGKLSSYIMEEIKRVDKLKKTT